MFYYESTVSFIANTQLCLLSFVIKFIVTDNFVVTSLHVFTLKFTVNYHKVTDYSIKNYITNIKRLYYQYFGKKNHNSELSTDNIFYLNNMFNVSQLDVGNVV